ncbi:protein-ADP-ribose hydrolase [Schaalia vaccimaxillae]|uniref:protein-ADP-ribose hydrolase n=1 Tax=Schaalia vaccimaxillae TaxID=183916 RepID=UPI0003B34A2D|nr:protein-ADP-ribose hydrolase [Schaalia vaccimaxillae]
MDASRQETLLHALVAGLCAERGIEPLDSMSADALWGTFRALVNTRAPGPTGASWLAMQDELLQGLIARAGIASLEDARPSGIDPRLSVWRGDITTLAVDGIVNAANSRMLGCWAPGHACIDNAIHTFAGVQLRAECARIMDEQEHDEPTGTAKITPAYNLPAGHVIHTVGPIANGRPTQQHRRLLASCYTSCLDIALDRGLDSIAFCCISTGVFGYPQDAAARVAVTTVREWLDARGTEMRVVFNVFSDADDHIYRDLLRA